MVNRILRTSIGTGLLTVLAGCRADGSPDFDIAPDPLSHLAAPLMKGLAPVVAERNPVSGAALYNIGDEYGRQQAARAQGNNVPRVNVYQNQISEQMRQEDFPDIYVENPKKPGTYIIYPGQDWRKKEDGSIVPRINNK